ncbi:MAG: hypothetical protein OXM01_14060 [Gemmatimonadota bacterium]|nr:hypothetical protein [Gemmatimonadota bacterium]
METKKRICLLLAALLSLNRMQPAAAADYQASDYLPLAVGNSWTYKHEYLDHNADGGDFLQYSVYWDQLIANGELPEHAGYPEVTISVLNTEVIDGKTYYVISDMPAYWPPAPPHFIAGKKLRWEGTRLMERTADGEQATFRFDGTTADYIRTDSRLEASNLYKTRYLIPTTEGDNRVVVIASLKPVPWYGFEFHGNDVGPRWCDFFASYGPTCRTGIFNVFVNQLNPLRAVIGGTSVEFADALIPTGISPSSWGQIKQSWSAGERNDQ